MTSKPVKFYSFQSYRPDLIQFQIDSFRHFIKDPEWELIIVNNAHLEKNRQEIKDICLRNNLREIEYSPKEAFGFAHGEAMMHIWQNYMIKDAGCISCFLDGDMFAVADFSVNEHMKNGGVFGGQQQQREHQWHWISPLLMMADIDNVPDSETVDWIGGFADNGTRLDTGGGMHRWLAAHPDIKKNNIRPMLYSGYICSDNNNRHVLPEEIQKAYQDNYTMDMLGECFLHYARSTNYDHKDPGYHARKTAFVRGFLKGCMENKMTIKKHGYMYPNEHFGWSNWP